jgi:hypothetical protein
MKRVLVIEDGREYEELARAFFSDVAITRAGDGGAALRDAANADCFLVDLRFDRLAIDALLGDLGDVAQRLFGGDRNRALRHLQDQQGVYILRALRQSGHAQRAVFVHDFSTRRLANLRALYGDVAAVPSFDVEPLRACLGIP